MQTLEKSVPGVLEGIETGLQSRQAYFSNLINDLQTDSSWKPIHPIMSSHARTGCGTRTGIERIRA